MSDEQGVQPAVQPLARLLMLLAGSRPAHVTDVANVGDVGDVGDIGGQLARLDAAAVVAALTQRAVAEAGPPSRAGDNAAGDPGDVGDAGDTGDAGSAADALLGLVHTCEQVISWVSAVQAAAITGLGAWQDAVHGPARGGFDAQDALAAELAAAMRWTGTATGTRMVLAAGLARFPTIAHALAAGDIDVPRARVLLDGLGGVTDTTATQVLTQLLPQAGRLTTGQLRPRLAALILHLDPATAERRRQQATRVGGSAATTNPTG